MRKTKVKNKKEIDEIIRNMTLMSDIMAKSAFEDRKCVECLVKALMGDDDIVIESFHVQYTINSLRKHSVTLDICVFFKDGSVADIEIQISDGQAEVRRARLYSSMLDNLLLPKNEDYKNLPDKYVFFVTLEDHFGDGLQVYHFENAMCVNGKLVRKLNDGAHIIYVTARLYDNETKLGRLLHDLCCKNPEDMYNKPLAERLDFFKNEPKGRNIMYTTFEQLMEANVVQGIKEEREEFASALIVDGKYSYKDIARLTKLSLEEVEAIAEELNGK